MGFDVKGQGVSNDAFLVETIEDVAEAGDGAAKEGESLLSSLGRALSVLDMFSLATPLVAVEEIIAQLGCSRSTAYRYLKELSDVGLLSPASNGSYGLGARIIELERLVALTDPLYRAGQEVLHGQPCDNSALLLHSLYGDKVLCIFKEGPDALEHDGKRVIIRRARGLPFPLFQGAASLALLPYLSAHRIREIYLRSPAEIASAGLGDSWGQFRRAMATIRRAGYATSHGRITPYLSGVAVPILPPDGSRVVGSLARTIPTAALSAEAEAQAAAELTELGQRIAERYLALLRA